MIGELLRDIHPYCIRLSLSPTKEEKSVDVELTIVSCLAKRSDSLAKISPVMNLIYSMCRMLQCKTQKLLLYFLL